MSLSGEGRDHGHFRAVSGNAGIAASRRDTAGNSRVRTLAAMTLGQEGECQ